MAGCLLFGCKSNHPYVWASQVPQSDVALETIPLRPGDQIQIQVDNWEDMKVPAQYTINADGSIVLPLIGILDVEGRTVEAVAQAIEASLKNLIVHPRARVSVVNPRVPVVTVLGEVQSPGRFEVAHGEGLLPALALAGGLTEFATSDRIFVVRKYPERQRIRFRYIDLVGGDASSVDFQLRDGDVIVVE